MLNPPSGTTTEAYIAAIRSGAATHMRFTQPGQTGITDVNFHEDGLVFRDLLNSDTDLTIGKSVKKEIAFKLFRNATGINFNSEFTADIGVEINGSTIWVPLGKFTAVYPDTYIDDGVTEYVAYDRMSKFDIPADEWLKSLTYPMTVSQMFTSLCTYVGLTGEIGNALTKMKNRSFSEAPIQNMGLMCRDVLELIAEACGCYAVITNTGNCRLKWYDIDFYTENGSSVVYTVSGNEIFDRKTKDYMTRIDGLNVKQSEDDVGVMYPSTATYTDIIYTIVDNPFLVTADSTEEDNYIVPLYNRLNSGQITHYPIEVTCIGNPLIEAGDIIYANVSGSTNAWFPVYVKEMHWNGSLTDTYFSTGSIKRQSYTSAIKQKLSQGGRYHIFKNTIDTLYSELYDPTTGDISVLDQRASALELSVADKYSIVSGIGITSAGVEVTGSKYVKIISGGSFLVDATNFKIDSENKLMKCGSWQFDNTGMRYTFANNNEFRIYNGADPYSSGGSYPANMKSGIRVHKPTGWNEFGILVPDYAGVLREFSFFPQGASAGMPGGVSFIAPGDIDNDIYAHTYGWYSVTSEYIYALQAINPSSRERKHDICPLDDKSELIDKLQPVSFVYNKDKKGKTCFGLIYEDTVGIIPEICFDEKEKGINYTELIPILLKEVQSLRKRVSSLENPTK